MVLFYLQEHILKQANEDEINHSHDGSPAAGKFVFQILSWCKANETNQ